MMSCGVLLNLMFIPPMMSCHAEFDGEFRDVMSCDAGFEVVMIFEVQDP